MSFPKLLFGTAGVPLSTPKYSILDGIKQVNKLNLEAMELEFVRQVNVTSQKAPDIKTAADKENVSLTCHGQYFINLNSKEPEKIKASVERILKAASIAWQCGAKSLTFHAAFYHDNPPQQVSEKVKEALQHITKTLQDNDCKIWIRPETTGKPSQWGTFEEITKIAQEVEQVLPCLDFSHIHSRTAGPTQDPSKYNTHQEFSKVFSHLEHNLGKEALNNLHIHLSGIEYGLKGEKNHLPLKDSDFNYKEFIRAAKDFNAKGIVISESPNIEADALLLKKEYERKI
jgi:deoxyribonuclease-4